MLLASKRVEARSNASHSTMHRTAPTAKNFLAPNIDRFEVEKLWYAGLSTSVVSPQILLQVSLSQQNLFRYPLVCQDLSFLEILSCLASFPTSNIQIRT